MYEEYDDDYRNYYEDDDDVRNARRRRPRRRPGWAPAPYPQQPVVMAPWQPAPPAPKAPPIVDRWGGLKLGLIADAAAQVLGAMTPLPTAPVATGTVATDLGAILEYQRKLAEHAKRDEQIRTAGALARLFLA